MRLAGLVFCIVPVSAGMSLGAERLSDFPIRVGNRTVIGLLAEPDKEHLAADPAIVLTLAATAREALTKPPYNEPAKVFLAAGHRALSFDLPEHGDRVAPGRTEGIAGMRQALLAGEDPFERLVADGRAAIDACLERHLTRAGRIYVCGVSRAGYCALRLAAADPRVGGAAGLAPVTDWRALREFADAKDRPEVAALSLENYADRLAGRPIYLAIGNGDDRVGTQCCTRFALRLFEEESQRKVAESRVCFLVVDDSAGHSLDLRWRRAGAEFLLRQIQ